MQDLELPWRQRTKGVIGITRTRHVPCGMFIEEEAAQQPDSFFFRRGFWKIVIDAVLPQRLAIDFGGLHGEDHDPQFRIQFLDIGQDLERASIGKNDIQHEVRIFLF